MTESMATWSAAIGLPSKLCTHYVMRGAITRSPKRGALQVLAVHCLTLPKPAPAEPVMPCGGALPAAIGFAVALANCESCAASAVNLQRVSFIIYFRPLFAYRCSVKSEDARAPS